MNLNDERNYQMCQSALDAMSLSEENRKLADEYLDTEQPENKMLLEKAVSQDFSKLSQESRDKCNSYLEHLKKRNRTEDLARYVRFCAAVGGATARYTLFARWYGNAITANHTKDYLTPEQQIAIQAEMVVWTKNLLCGMPFKELSDFGGKNLQAVLKAMDISQINAKILLAAIYLHHMKPSGSRKGILKGLFSKPEKENTDDVSKVSAFLSGAMIAGADSLADNGQTLTGADRDALKDFLCNADVNAPFTGEIQRILGKGGSPSDYLTQLLSGCAFLAIEHSDRFLLFLRFAIHVNPQEALDSCKNMCRLEWMRDHMELVEEALPVDPAVYGRWCAINRIDQPLRRMAKSNPDTVRQILPSLSTTEYQFLLDQIAKGNPSLYQEMNANYNEEFRSRLASEMTDRFQTGRTEARDYLLGKAGLEQLYPFVDDWQKNRWSFMTWDDYKSMAQLRDGKDVPMFRRAIVTEAIGCKTGFCISNQVFPTIQGTTVYNYRQVVDKKQVLAIFDVLGQEQVPVIYQLKFMEALYDSYYQESYKTMFLNECVKALAEKKAAWTEELTDYARNGSALVRFLCIRVLDISWNEHKELLLSCASDSSKQVKELLVTVYASHKEWEPEILDMLSSRKAQERELAVQVLGKWGTASYREQLQKALEAEKSKKIKDQILPLLGMEVDTADPEQSAQGKSQTMEQLAAELLKGGKKRKVEWVGETMFTPVHKLDGSEAPGDYLQAILVAYADMRTPGVSQDAARLAAELNQKELADFMGLLFSKWVDMGAEAKKKWVLYAASIHGGDTIVPTLHHQIQVWPEAARGAIAAEAVRALALNGSSTALLLVDQISRKFKNRQVKSAAGEALTYAAQQLGITRSELEDRIVPNLDFDERMERCFDFGSRSFRVRLTPMLEVEVFDESGKKLKNLPAPGKQDDQEKAKAASDAFKLMKKQLKTVVTNQKLRLEQALSAERLWTSDKWQELFVKNPIMHQFAIGLIWGVYDRRGADESGQTSASGGGMTLKDTFRYMEDGSFNTVDEEEYELPENALIGLVHPVELTADALAAWKEQLSDYEVTQPFEQLERPVYRITEEEKKEKELSRFGGVLLNGLSLSGKLLGQGWFRGAVEDAGVFHTYYRNDGTNGAELDFSGAAVGYEGEDVTVYGVYFYPSGEAAQGSYRYQRDYEEKRCLLSQVSPRYFSEIVLLLTRATASSQEKLPYPECKNNRY